MKRKERVTGCSTVPVLRPGRVDQQNRYGGGRGWVGSHWEW